jgi:hypothetical protein
VIRNADKDVLLQAQATWKTRSHHDRLGDLVDSKVAAEDPLDGARCICGFPG